VTITIVEDALVQSRATPSEGEPSTSEPQQQLQQQRDVEKDEEAWAPKQLPLVWEFWSILPIALIYATARAYILIEPLLGLRSMQAGAFDTVDWMAFLPHVG
jgi:hypothetical protein